MDSIATAAPLPEILSVEDVMTILKISRPSVYGLINSGQLKTLKIGRLRRVRRADFEAFLDSAAAD